MRLSGIVRFELGYQLRRPWPLLSFAVLLLFALLTTGVAIVPVTLPQDFILNSPFVITSVTVFSCQIWLLLTPMVAGEAAARDVHTGMHPLMYTTPTSRLEYLGGRFLAAFILHALILLAVQIGSLLAVYSPGTNADIVGPFRPAAYLAAYGYIALPNALIATTVQFSAALLTGRPMAAYVGSFALFFLSYPVTLFLLVSRVVPSEIALLFDPIGVLAIMNEMMSNWTIAEKNVRMFTLEGGMLWNRLLWVGVSLAIIPIVFTRFRFEHRTTKDLFRRIARWWPDRPTVAPDQTAAIHLPIAVNDVPANAGASLVTIAHTRIAWTTHVRQVLAVAGSSFRMIATSAPGLFLLLGFPVLLTLMMLVELQHWGVPLVPTTAEMVSRYLTFPVTDPVNYWVMVPLLIIYLAGELIWRERDARLNENVDATPTPDWVLCIGKYAGLCAVLVVFMAVLTVGTVVIQALRGYDRFDVGLLVTLLFGFQLPEYLLFAMLVLAVQVVVNHKYVGQISAFIAYMLLVFASYLGIEHNLLIYGAGPAWAYTDMRGFGGTVLPWLWFKLYWVAWALLLAVVARLLWVRGVDTGLTKRLRVARQRFSRATILTGATTLAVILLLGGFIFYNTNVLHDFITTDELARLRADYEIRYGKFEGRPQPERVHTELRVELYPARRSATAQGRFVLVNRSGAPIDSVHVEPVFGLATAVTFDRPFRQVLSDRRLGHDIYELDEPLQPGDTMALDFELSNERRGFSHGSLRSNGAGQAILANGTYLTDAALPILGYQPRRELTSAEERRRFGLPRQLTLPSPGDIDPDVVATTPATSEVIIGTDAGQVAVAPGRLRRTWTEGGRRYFHYGSDVPITGQHVFFSADYAAYRESWSDPAADSEQDVEIQVYLHPGHAAQAERVLRSLRASLEYYSREFGQYPWDFLQVVEQPGNFFGMGVDGSGLITGGESFFLLDPTGDGFDVISEVVAHEVGHQWWGMQLKPAWAEGGGVISEGLATYSAMRLVKHVKGREALRQYVSQLREPSPWPEIRTGLPLLRAIDPWSNYRKGPYVMNALSEYIGEEKVHGALRELVAERQSSLSTTLDLYRALQAVTPDSLQAFLADLFERTVFWSFDTKAATAVHTPDGAWQVTLEVEAHKVVSDSIGPETEIPLTEWVEIGVYAAAGPRERLGKPLYLERHAIRSGTQTLTITVPERPARAGVDPYHLLDWGESENIQIVEVSEPD